MSEVLLTCRGVSKSYGGVHALRSADLDVRAGEIVGLVGPNGAGKTTFVDCITGQQFADTGEIHLRKTPLVGAPSKRARAAGLARTFQHPQLALDMTVRENLTIAAASHHFASTLGIVRSLVLGVPKSARVEERVEEIAEEMHIERLDRLVEDLTLGEQRLVEVARAFLREPTLLLLDEPFAGGDPKGVGSMTEVLHRSVERGCGVLVVDHNVDIVASLVDRMVLMDMGQIVFDGDPAEAMASKEMRDVYFGTTGV